MSMVRLRYERYCLLCSGEEAILHILFKERDTMFAIVMGLIVCSAVGCIVAAEVSVE
ncbi:hypothetical protein HRF87_04040 [Bacillus sp. CRN 9]|nr:hypothetical protein [Bacillus sp. CRN 9]